MEMSQLQGEKDDLQQAVEEQQELIINKNDEINEITQKLTDMQNEYDYLKNHVSEMQKELEDTQNQNNQFKEDVFNVQQKLDESNEANEYKIATLSNELSSSIAKVKELEADRGDLNILRTELHSA